MEQLGNVDIVVGIPTFSSASSIGYVMKTIIKGLDRYYPDRRALLVVSDGGSTDDTRELARDVDPKSYNIESIVTIYRGLPGKGSGLRAVFEIGHFLKARAVAVFDSDLQSITPEWLRNVLEPVMEGYDFVAPDYKRYKLDGTITNTIAYNLLRALYGWKIRQPIGGDFGVSPALAKYYLDQDVWETDVAKFGIDIWMTTSAIVGGFRICQTRLGAKIHGQKDPSADLGPMFRQVVGTTFLLMDQYQDFWLNVKGARDVPTLGEAVGQDPEAFEIDQEALVEYFRMGLKNFSGVWQNILAGKDLKVVRELSRIDRMDRFLLPTETWVRIVYQCAGIFKASSRQRFKLLDTMIPLYYARVASLVNELRDKSTEEAETFFEEQAQAFETMKHYMVEVWKRKGGDLYG
jgi:glycosyltransferase involved in cell wall biosynthesis